jgi:O-antigen ligase
MVSGKLKNLRIYNEKKYLYFILFVFIFFRPSPQEWSVGAQFFDAIIFIFVCVNFIFIKYKLDKKILRKVPLQILMAIVIVEIISLCIAVLNRNVVIQDVLEFTRWIMYVPLFIVGVTISKNNLQSVFKSYEIALLLIATYTLLLFLNVFDLKIISSSIYDLTKSRGLENEAAAVGLFRIASTFGNPNYLGIFFVISFSFLASKVLFYREKLRYIFGCVLLMMLIIITGSRTAMISLIIVLQVISVIAYFSMPSILSKLLVVAQILIGLLGVFYFYNNWMDLFWRFNNTDNILESFGARTEAWSDAYKIIISSPLFMVFGYGSDKENYQSLDNNYITFLFKNGIIGLILFITIIVSSIIKSLKNLSSNDVEYKFLGSTVLCSTLVMATASLSSIPYHHTQLAMMYFIFLGASYSQNNNKTRNVN